MSKLENHAVGETWQGALATVTRVVTDGVEEDRYDYSAGEVIYQRACPERGCDGGLLYVPPGRLADRRSSPTTPTH